MWNLANSNFPVKARDIWAWIARRSNISSGHICTTAFHSFSVRDGGHVPFFIYGKIPNKSVTFFVFRNNSELNCKFFRFYGKSRTEADSFLLWEILNCRTNFSILWKNLEKKRSFYSLPWENSKHNLNLIFLFYGKIQDRCLIFFSPLGKLRTEV